MEEDHYIPRSEKIKKAAKEIEEVSVILDDILTL